LRAGRYAEKDAQMNADNIQRTRILPATILLIVTFASNCDFALADGVESPSPIKSFLKAQNIGLSRDGNDVLTKQELIKALGPPTMNRKRLTLGADYEMVWQERSYIEIQTKGGRIQSANGGFSRHIASSEINLIAFQKIRVGMTEADARKILGKPSRAESIKDGKEVKWLEVRELSVRFKSEVVTAIVSIDTDTR
jgi:outer membrane protein assembly factor BamE (lipoprotein component of BamABCDE complex)